jgi:hypothetical protein
MRITSLLATACTALLLARTAPADIPAPPVNQIIGMLDVLSGEMSEADCRRCHDSGISNRHHSLYGQPIPPGSMIPYPDSNGDGQPDSNYTCLGCHGSNFTVETNCIVCHTSNAHHNSPAAKRGDCASCHGDIVDSIGDGHYIPSYAPGLTTPAPSDGTGLPLNRYGNGAGACNYCHDEDDPVSPFIRNNADLHHDASMNCLWCHSAHGPQLVSIRVCENCHGPDSLHGIQADSPAPGNIGTIVIGGEYAGYGHVGRDAMPGDSDCWGCHGYSETAVLRSCSPIPAIYDADLAVIPAGTDTMVLLAGAAFTNSVGGTLYEPVVAMEAVDGSSVVLTPDVILDEGMLAVTIPKTTAAGNYRLRAVTDGAASNPTVVTVVPKPRIDRAAGRNRTVVIRGSGFGGYAPRSGTAVRGRFRTVQGGRVTTKYLNGTIASWDDGRIVVRFPSIPHQVTLRTIFGNASSPVAAATR